MHLVSERSQAVTIDDRRFGFDEGETICTEYSYKYTLEAFTKLVHAAGGEIEKVWTDDKQYFAVAYVTIS